MNQANGIKVFTADAVLPIEREEIAPGALAIGDGKILEVGDPETLKVHYPQAHWEDWSGSVLMPGLVNAQADLSLARFQMSDQDTFKMSDGRILLMPWLINLSRYKSKITIPEQQKAVRAGLNLMKKTGVTTVGDQCRYASLLPVYKEGGLRTVCLAEIENIQRPLAQEEFEQALALVDEVLHEDHPKITAGYAPFAPYTLSKNLLKILADHALHQEVPLHIFAALSFSEMEFFYDSLGEISAVLFKEAGWADKIPPPHRMTPIQYLQEIGFLKVKPTLVGCLHLGPTDAAIIENTECLRLYSPRAFHYLQIGEIPFAKIIPERIPWALGTLGKNWGSSGNLWDEMRTVLNEFEGESRNAAAREILQAATLSGARALRLQNLIGSLVPGKAADFLAVETPQGDDSMAASLIDQTRDGSVKASWVLGERLL